MLVYRRRIIRPSSAQYSHKYHGQQEVEHSADEVQTSTYVAIICTIMNHQAILTNHHTELNNTGFLTAINVCMECPRKWS